MDLDLDTVRLARTRADLALAPGERFLAGGTFLYSEPLPSGVTGLVDLLGLGWEPWTIDGSGLRVSATCTVEEVRAGIAALGAPTGPYRGLAIAQPCADALLLSFKVAHTATVGGNLCLALPAAAMVSLFAGLGAGAVVWLPDPRGPGGGTRTQPLTELVTGPGFTTLAPGELLREVRVPASALAARSAFRRIALTPLGRSSAVVTGRDVAAHDVAGPTGDRVRVVLTASVPRPVELDVARGDHAALDRALDGITTWFDDSHGAPDWRAAVTRRLAHEVLEELA